MTGQCQSFLLLPGTCANCISVHEFVRRKRRFFRRPKSEGRKSIAQCVSTGARVGSVAPERGVRIRMRASFAPFRGWLIGNWGPRLAPWARIFRPPGSYAKHDVCRVQQCGADALIRSRPPGRLFASGKQLIVRTSSGSRGTRADRGVCPPELRLWRSGDLGINGRTLWERQ